MATQNRRNASNKGVSKNTNESSNSALMEKLSRLLMVGLFAVVIYGGKSAVPAGRQAPDSK